MYVIECADGSLYTGYSPDVQARFAAHQAGTARSTRAARPAELAGRSRIRHQAQRHECRVPIQAPKPATAKDELLAKATDPEANFAKLLQEEFGF